MTATLLPIDVLGARGSAAADEPSPLTSAAVATPSEAKWAKAALVVLLVGTAVLYVWGLGASGWANSFYSAAVEAGSKSWKAFFFGSFDSSNFITVDKPPASLWIMDLSARIFGLNAWSILLPQALEGVAAVAVLFATVRRWFGFRAGLLAGAVLALTPVATLMFRYDNPDALLVLLLVGAAWATTRAIETGRTRWLLLMALLVGTGFLTKMMQAFIVVPAFGTAYLVAGPPHLWRRLRQLLAAGMAMIVASGWWVAIVQLVPTRDRPYVGGSTDDSELNLIFGYNGFGRLDGNETGSVHGAGAVGSIWGPTGWDRMFTSTFGGQISWLIPASLVLLCGGLWLTRRAPRTDRTRAALVLWGLWLLVTDAVFSYGQGIIHPYYSVALAPAIAALVAIGAVVMWRHRHELVARAIMAVAVAGSALWSYVLLDRSPSWLPWLRLGLVVCGVIAAVVLLAAPRLSGWLWPAPASAMVPDRRGQSSPISGAEMSANERWPDGRGQSSPISGAQMSATGPAPARLFGAAAGLALLASLAGPAAYSIDTAATAHTGAIPSAGPVVAGALGGAGGALPGGIASGGRRGRVGLPGTGARPATGGTGSFPGPGGLAGGPPSGLGLPGTGSLPTSGSLPATGSLPTGGVPGRRLGAGAGGGLLDASQPGKALVSLLKSGAAHYTWVAAVVGANSAAGYQLGTDEPVMAIGGFNGTDPAPSLATFEGYVRAGKIHYFIGGGGAAGNGPQASSTSDAAQITGWVEAHYKAETIDGATVYDLAG
ncbi:MAG TPA: glycosyltransferase family 39 protein [Acidimicrobiales bacterium]|jgi:4-amino-4-deoxy-L-arabinose transferase-like glycosyltransferase|nr:glycosyltransferase family 39 protein [Acidimicrobiales bacterium]